VQERESCAGRFCARGGRPHSLSRALRISPLARGERLGGGFGTLLAEPEARRHLRGRRTRRREPRHSSGVNETLGDGVRDEVRLLPVTGTLASPTCSMRRGAAGRSCNLPPFLRSAASKNASLSVAELG